MFDGLTYSFTSATMAQKVAVVLFSNSDLGSSDNGSSKSGSEKISILVDSIALNCSEDNLLDELFLEVLNDHTLSAKSESLLLNGIKVLYLTNIGKETLLVVRAVGKTKASLSKHTTTSYPSRISHFRIVEVSRPLLQRQHSLYSSRPPVAHSSE